MTEKIKSETFDDAQVFMDSIEANTSESTEEWKSSRIDKLAAALSKAQGEIEGAAAKSENPFYKSTYADLHTVIKSATPALSKHGLAVIQGNKWCSKSNGFFITTMLVHESGQWIKSEIRMPIGKKDAQGVGATMTYGRRYGFSAMVGVAQYDDDGNSIIK
jgi:hypothetical protein